MADDQAKKREYERPSRESGRARVCYNWLQVVCVQPPAQLGGMQNGCDATGDD